MRRSTLLILLLPVGAGCADAPASAGGRVVERFVERSEPLACEIVPLDSAAALTELRSTSDTTWALLDEAQRRARGFDDRMRPLWTLELAPEGPLGLPEPVGLAVAGDTVVHLVDRGRLALVSLRTDGGGGRSLRLDFIPGGVLVLPDGSPAVTPLPLGRRPAELLFLVRGDSLVPVDVPQRRYADLSINGLGNMLVAEADAAGGVLLVHRYLAPRAFRVEPDGAVRALEPPVPDGTARKREYVPEPPVTEDQLPLTYVGAAAMSLDRRTGEVYLITQSGRREGEWSEKALLRLDPDLGYRASYLLDMNAGHLAYLARRRAVVIGDDEDRIHVCDLPPILPR